jgi:ATP-dependent Clp protease adaptor protein ClpS
MGPATIGSMDTETLPFPKEKATQHMLEVHQKGKSIVAMETREKAELYYQQIQAYGLNVSLEPG